jgi:hypothetical protein
VPEARSAQKRGGRRAAPRRSTELELAGQSTQARCGVFERHWALTRDASAAAQQATPCAPEAESRRPKQGLFRRPCRDFLVEQSVAPDDYERVCAASSGHSAGNNAPAVAATPHSWTGLRELIRASWLGPTVLCATRTRGRPSVGSACGEVLAERLSVNADRGIRTRHT